MSSNLIAMMFALCLFFTAVAFTIIPDHGGTAALMYLGAVYLGIAVIESADQKEKYDKDD